MTRTIEVATTQVSGKVVSTGRGKSDDVTYVRFQGAGGQVNVMVPDGVKMGNVQLRAGAEVTVLFDVMFFGPSMSFRAYEVRNGLAEGERVK